MSNRQKLLQRGLRTQVTAHDRAMFGWPRSRLVGFLFRVPIWLYRLHLGWLFGHRLLLLTHRGRTSGRIHQTLLEVAHYDPRSAECVVVSPDAALRQGRPP